MEIATANDTANIFNVPGDIHVLYLKGGNYAHNGFSDFLEQLGCKVSVATNDEKFVQQFHEAQVNAFNIFGNDDYKCLILDLFSASDKSFSALRQLRQTYSSLPPVIGLTTPEQSLKLSNLKSRGFDEVVGYPLPRQELIESFYRWIGQEQPAETQNSFGLPPEEKFDNYPVMSLRTYSSLSEQAGKNGFSLLPLYTAFLGEMDDYVKQFIKAYEVQDRSIYEPTIIAIKGLCATMGASQVYQVASRIEGFSRNEQPDQVGVMLPFLIEKYLVLKEYITQWKKRQGIVAA
jgi:CheY-like chemotaxis protein